ncbi:DUF5696 domain-containing protein [Alkalihalobacillus trypoxylicola]|uniref:Uncharacterized protein n=1 Tax=Alkalihalobacillus trypoxylicola TaxID=519424 RepID=A0A162F2J2_9BACI|nr:DUF5696 domain-containing protein [Alkalihalobacillus trypoxylicola]KYG34346.1 hypothetical protein AZF04_14225 [Alkalihalobacillus trypoxylicola]
MQKCKKWAKNKISLISLSFLVFILFPIVVAANDGSSENLEEEEGIETVDEGEDIFTEEELPVVTVEELASLREDFQNEDVTNYLETMELISENQFLSLYFKASTTEIAVVNKSSNQIWFSNPIDLESDSLVGGENKEHLRSQISFTYYSSNGQTTRMNSAKSVNDGLVEYEKVENGIKVIYSFGQSKSGLERIPEKITKERFETVILNKIEDEKAKNDLEKRFAFNEEEQIYERREASFPVVVVERTIQLFDEIGYTEEELAVDLLEFEQGVSEELDVPFFTIPIVYKLENEHFNVSFLSDEMEQNEKYPISDLMILPFFGAANEHKEGFMFVPDGSGALIHLNNGKSNYQRFSAPLYGRDQANFSRQRMEVSEPVRLPVFGMNQKEGGFLAIIEEGSGIASIEADVAGRLNLYNSIFTTFKLKESGEVTLSGGERESTVALYQLEDFKGNISITYAFLQENASYVDMAEYYRDHLFSNHESEALIGDKPFYLELVGSIWKRKTFLGIPYKYLEPLTTFDEAEIILEELLEGEIANIHLRYTGWFNEGVDHKLPTKINIDRKVGGEAGFQRLSQFIDQKGLGFYPDVAFTHVHRSSFDFSPSKDASRFITRRVAEVYPYNPASFLRDTEKTPFYVLSPSLLPSVIDEFSQSYSELGLVSLSLRDLGYYMNSDYRQNAVVNREEARIILEEQFKYLNEQFPNLMASGGNALAFPYSKHLLNIPLSSSGYNITDRSIPFIQIVLHGHREYASYPINLAADQNIQKQMLRLLETGSSPYFKWFYEEPAIVKDTEFNDLMSSHYQLWIDDAISMYQEVNHVLKAVRNLPIMGHEEVEKGLYRTQYGEEAAVWVNYNSYPIEIDGTVIEPENYLFRKEG